MSSVLPSLWPESAGPGSTVVSCRINGNIDEVFHCIWIDQSLAALLHKTRSDSNFFETEWSTSKEDLPTKAFTDWGVVKSGKGENKKDWVSNHRYRKVRFDSAPSALASKPFRNEELQQCTKYQPGKLYIMEVLAQTNAPYGDKFKIFIRHDMTALSKSMCALRISYGVVWDPSMSFFLKPVVSAALEGGLRSALLSQRECLGKFHTCADVPDKELLKSMPSIVSDIEEEVEMEEIEEIEITRGLEKAISVPSRLATLVKPSTPVAATAAAGPLPPSSLLDFLSEQLVYREQAVLLSEAIGKGLRSLGNQGAVGVKVLSALMTLAMISTTISVLKVLQNGCRGCSPGSLSWIACLPLTHLVYLPDSTSEVLSSLTIVALVNWGIMRASHFAVSKLDSNLAECQRELDVLQSARQLQSNNNAGTANEVQELIATDLQAAAVPAAAAAVALKPASQISSSKAEPSTSPDSSKISSKKSSTQSLASSAMAAVKEGTGKLKEAMTPGSASGSTSGGAEAGPSDSASDSKKAVVEKKKQDAIPKSTVSKSPSRLKRSSQPGQVAPFPAMEMADMSFLGGATGHAATTAAPPLEMEGMRRTSPLSSTSGVAGPAMRPSGSGMPQGNNILMSSSLDDRSWIDSVTDSFKGAWQKSQAPLKTFLATSAEEAEFGLLAMVPTEEWGATAAGQKEKVLERSKPASPGATSQGRRPSEAGSVASIVVAVEDPDIVVEEVFENERFQPFRLWGHTWPGHFLPSDRVGHWSDRTDGPAGPANMEFDQVAPKLPNDGWAWLEEQWELDMSGIEEDAIDKEGWYYALDFNYLIRRPASGKCISHHFVRRRRWYRTRARLGMDPSRSPVIPVPQAMDHSPSTTPSKRNLDPTFQLPHITAMNSAAASALMSVESALAVPSRAGPAATKETLSETVAPSAQSMSSMQNRQGVNVVDLLAPKPVNQQDTAKAPNKDSRTELDSPPQALSAASATLPQAPSAASATPPQAPSTASATPPQAPSAASATPPQAPSAASATPSQAPSAASATPPPLAGVEAAPMVLEPVNKRLSTNHQPDVQPLNGQGCISEGDVKPLNSAPAGASGSTPKPKSGTTSAAAAAANIKSGLMQAAASAAAAARSAATSSRSASLLAPRSTSPASDSSSSRSAAAITVSASDAALSPTDAASRKETQSLDHMPTLKTTKDNMSPSSSPSSLSPAAKQLLDPLSRKNPSTPPDSPNSTYREQRQQLGLPSMQAPSRAATSASLSSQNKVKGKKTSAAVETAALPASSTGPLPDADPDGTALHKYHVKDDREKSSDSAAAATDLGAELRQDAGVSTLKEAAVVQLPSGLSDLSSSRNVFSSAAAASIESTVATADPSASAYASSLAPDVLNNGSLSQKVLSSSNDQGAAPSTADVPNFFSVSSLSTWSPDVHAFASMRQGDLTPDSAVDGLGQLPKRVASGVQALPTSGLEGEGALASKE
ncbi:hypothetical protein CEUSTIGMA_g3333.t1 [Chlamydomonas eustigma]|uniref:VASt domain-containing protein n=1 Tax=Chlamydomonas eustigma TaxID=1157962 RepID=A0A250WZF7_9CHLO|nr:hypothetical protein CEUSTIGMA_g3333.t1 [Chlamydomonas eustigma]|eukprot:GAX75890.1 hypothetical protein CEUSTIGMA_g3333.t1 [Chlamydomonas eustigma]